MVAINRLAVRLSRNPPAMMGRVRCGVLATLAQIDRKEIERYKARKHAEGLTNKTINNHLAVLGKALVCAEEWDQLERAPRIKLLHIVPPPVEILTDKECERLLADKVEPPFGAMVLVALRTGLRLGELLGLQWSDEK